MNPNYNLVKHREITFSNPQMDLMETTAQRVLGQMGVGSGKSHCIGMIAFDFVSKNPEVRGFIGANTYGQLTKSTLDRVFKVWEEVYGLIKGVHYVVDRIPPESFVKIGPMLKTYENTISFNNGGLIFLASLDNYKVIDGTEFGWALLDETKDTKEAAVKEVIVARLRQLGMMVGSNGVIYKTRKYNKETGEVDDLLAKRLAEGVYRHDPEQNKYYKGDIELVGYTPLYIFTSPAKAPWIMEWFGLGDDAEEIEKCIYNKDDYYRKRKGDQLVVIASTYHNEHNLSPGYIDRLIKDQGGDEGKVAMLVYGSPFGKTGGEYYSSYRRLLHVKEFDPWDDEPVHITFDFNVVPYMTALMGQMKFNTKTNRYLLRIFDEACLENPNNSTPAVCKEIIQRHGPTGTNVLKPGGVFYYGDYSGKNRQTLSEEYKHQYDVIEKLFKLYLNNLSDRVRPNLLHITRRGFMCNLFMGVHPVDIEIHKRCKHLTGDLEFVKVGPNGEKVKTKTTEDGVSFEEHGHTSDALDYLCCSAFDNLLTAH